MQAALSQAAMQENSMGSLVYDVNYDRALQVDQ